MPIIKAVPEQLFNLKSKLSSTQIKCDEAHTNVQKVIAGLDWEIASKSSINDRLTTVQKRLRKQSGLMQQYLGFLDTAGGRFEATDKDLRDKSKDIIYQLGQVGVGLSVVNTNPKVDFESGMQISGIDDVAILFGGATPAVSLVAGTSAAALAQTKQTLAITPAVAAASAAVGASGTTTTTTTTTTTAAAAAGAAVGATSATTATTTTAAAQSSSEIVVTFDPYGGTTTVASQKVKKLVPIYGTLPTPKCNDLKFMGWYTAKTGGAKISSGFPVTSLTNHTLYARWEVKVTFELLPAAAAVSIGASLLQNTQAKYVIKGTTYAEAIKSVTEPKKTGYTFDGWYNGKTKIAATTVCNDTKNVTLKPEWSKNVTGVSITGHNAIDINLKKKLTATITPSDASNKKVTWKSKNPAIVKVNEQTGEITGVAKGSTEITVTTDDGKKTATLGVKVPEGWIWPIAGGAGKQNTCLFGCKSCDPYHTAKKPHQGIDINGCGGKNVVAARGGEITQIQVCGEKAVCKTGSCTTCYGRGTNVTIKHQTSAGDVTTQYLHLRSNSTTGLKKGPISQGEKVGVVGTTGSSTGEHLHLTIKNASGTAVNPNKYIPGVK